MNVLEPHLYIDFAGACGKCHLRKDHVIHSHLIEFVNQAIPEERTMTAPEALNAIRESLDPNMQALIDELVKGEES